MSHLFQFSSSEEKKIKQVLQQKLSKREKRKRHNVSQENILSLLAQIRSKNCVKAAAEILYLFEQEEVVEERERETASPPSSNEFIFPDSVPETKTTTTTKPTVDNVISILSSAEEKEEGEKEEKNKRNDHFRTRKIGQESFPLHPFAEIFRPLLLSAPVFTKKRSKQTNKKLGEEFRTVFHVDSCSNSSESETEMDHNSDLDSPSPPLTHKKLNKI